MKAWRRRSRRGWSPRRVTAKPSDGGRKGGLTTAGMDGRRVATKVAMLAVMTEGPWNGGLRRRRVAW